MPNRILIVEDEDTLRVNLARYLTGLGYQVEAAQNADDAAVLTQRAEFDVALVDIRLPGKDGVTLAKELVEQGLSVFLMTAYGTVESVIEALRFGVQDYLLKPLVLKEVAARIAHLLEFRQLQAENARLRRALSIDLSRGEVVYRSRQMEEVLAFVRQVAQANSTVLIDGESGTGKEVIARALHSASPRREGPFLAINMTAMPESLAESLLFGHEKGAFTGADSAQEGLFRAATGGTLLLDEIGDLSLGMQAKLLRALEAKEVIPVGGSRPVRVDCRIIAATNVELHKAVQERRFRSDLFYRLSAIRVHLPPLRERPEDIAALANHFLQWQAREQKKPVTGIEPAAMQKLMSYPWPGNVRELSNVIERAVVLASGASISPLELPIELVGTARATGPSYDEAMSDFERALFKSTLEATDNDRKEAARRLGISLATLYRRIEKLGLAGHDAPQAPAQEGTG